MPGEILVLSGPPGAGKTKLGEALVRRAAPACNLLTVSERRRKIISGAVASDWAEQLRALNNHPKRRPDLDAARHDAINGIIGEAISENEHSLTIIDGASRYSRHVMDFQETAERLSVKILGILMIKDVTPQELAANFAATEAALTDEQRLYRGSAGFSLRMSDFCHGNVPAMAELSNIHGYPIHYIDGRLPVEANVEHVAQLYARLSQPAT